MKDLESTIGGLNQNEKRLIEIKKSRIELEEKMAKLKDPAEIDKIYKQLTALREEKGDILKGSLSNFIKTVPETPFEDVKNEEEIKTIDPEKIEGRLFSIPERNGCFRMENEIKEKDRAFYKINKEGNVYLIDKGEEVIRCINQYEYYLKPAFDIKNTRDADKSKGYTVKKLAKIDLETGQVIEKGIIIFTEEKGVKYELDSETINTKEKDIPNIQKTEAKVVKTNKEEETKAIEKNGDLITWEDLLKIWPDREESYYKKIKDNKQRQTVMESDLAQLNIMAVLSIKYLKGEITAKDLIKEEVFRYIVGNIKDEDMAGYADKEAAQFKFVLERLQQKETKTTAIEPEEITVKDIENQTEPKQPDQPANNVKKNAEYESKKAEIEKERDFYKIDWGRIQNHVDRMLGNDEQNESKKKSQIEYTFRDNLITGLATNSLNQVHKETGTRSYSSTIYWLEDMLAYVKVIEEGKKLGFINNEEYKKLLEKYQKAKDLLENEYKIEKEKGEELINKKLAELDKKFGKESQSEETSLIEGIEEKTSEGEVEKIQNNVDTENLEDKEVFTEEEKKILNNLLNQIEMTKKRMAEIEIEQEKRKKLKETQIQDVENKQGKENNEKQPFSFNVEFIKNKIEEIISSNKNIKKIEGLSIIPGPNNEFILNVNKIVAEFKFLFTFTTEITVKNAHLINNEKGIKLNDGYEIKATDYEKKVKEKITENLDKINNEIIKIIEKEINKKVEKIWIENGELKAL